MCVSAHRPCAGRDPRGNAQVRGVRGEVCGGPGGARHFTVPTRPPRLAHAPGPAVGPAGEMHPFHPQREKASRVLPSLSPSAPRFSAEFSSPESSSPLPTRLCFPPPHCLQCFSAQAVLAQSPSSLSIGGLRQKLFINNRGGPEISLQLFLRLKVGGRRVRPEIIIQKPLYIFFFSSLEGKMFPPQN